MGVPSTRHTLGLLARNIGHHKPRHDGLNGHGPRVFRAPHLQRVGRVFSDSHLRRVGRVRLLHLRCVGRCSDHLQRVGQVFITSQVLTLPHRVWKLFPSLCGNGFHSLAILGVQ